jgi:multidrug efflux system membrane fusion protein
LTAPFLALRFGKASVPAAAAVPQAIPVTATHATRRDLPITRSGLGTVAPLNQVDVKVRADGQLQNLAFQEGGEVGSGDLLAQIDPRPYQAQLAQAEAVLQKDVAQLANARNEDARATRLGTTGAGTKQAADLAKAQVAIDEAVVEADQAAIDTARLNLEFTRILAPIAGRLGFKQVNEGAVLHASDAAGVVTITQIHPIAVQFALPQDELPALLAGQARTPLRVSIETRDGARHLTDGQLTVIDSQVDVTTGMIKLKAEFANDDRALWPGALVTARVLLRTDAQTTVVPSAAIQNGQNGPYLFVVKPDSTVSIVSVRTGPVVDEWTAVLSGVSAGDNIVLSGQSRLAPGTAVRVTQADAASHVAMEAAR